MNDLHTDIVDLPGNEDLSRHIHFEAKNGKIWLDEQRVILETQPALMSFRQELLKSLGFKRYKALMLRSGYNHGQLDAELAIKSRPNQSIEEVFLAGPQLHMLRGMAKVIPITLKIDKEKNIFFMDTVWADSYEVDISLPELDGSDQPVCWSLIGYASGFSSRIMGMEIFFKETCCRGKGDHECRIIGKPLAEWDNIDDYKSILSSEPLIDILYELQSKISDNLASEKNDGIFDTLIGKSKTFQDVCTMANRAATSHASVLLTGETGVGKELMAKGIHQQSQRSTGPFIAINCAAIPPDLIESELFGVEKGAYTGAVQSRKGRFERADGGTIFLDEVAELSARAQSSLLRVLQEREFERVGDNQVRKLDVRIITATNENLEESVKQGRFRADLFYRLNVFPLHIPPLRERRDDIPLLVEHFLDKYESQYAIKTHGLTDKAMNAILSHDWPGNIRELENSIERGVIMTEKNDHIRVKALFATVSPSQPHEEDTTSLISGLPDNQSYTHQSISIDALLDEIFNQSLGLEDIETLLLKRALALSCDNVSKAARLLQMSRPTFAYRLKKCGLLEE